MKKKCGYHSNCKMVALTHLCFADYLMVFTNGTEDSILGVFAILQHFYTMYGLQLNK